MQLFPQLIVIISILDHLSTSQASNIAIVGYDPDTNVADRAKIDLDQKAIEEDLAIPNFSAAKSHYINGGNSVKSDGSIRTIQDLSVNNCKILNRGLPQFNVYNNYWRSKGLTNCQFGDDMVNAAFDATALGSTGFTFAASENPVTGSDDFRVQAIQKSTVYEIVMMYTMYEVQDAIVDCENSDFTNNTGSVKAIDEAVAFHVGSQEGQVKGGIDGLMTTSGNVRYLMFALAEKRCANFGTCTADAPDANPTEGYSAVNSELMSLFTDLQSQFDLAAGLSHTPAGWSCSDAETIRDSIFSKLLVPLVQGVLRYLWKTDPAVGTATNKELGELWAFATAILPMVDSVDSEVASALYERAWSQDFNTNDFASMKTMLESTYSGLGITCADVGQLCDNTNSGSDCVPYSEPYSTATCVDASTSSSSASSAQDDSALIGGLSAMAVIIFVVSAVIIWHLYRKNKATHQRLLEFEGGASLGMQSHMEAYDNKTAVLGV